MIFVLAPKIYLFLRGFSSRMGECRGSFVTAARERMSKKEFSSFFADISHIESRYFDKLSSDVSLFVKKFDYRYENEPWGDSRDSTERAIKFLTADIHRDSTEKKPSGGLT